MEGGKPRSVGWIVVTADDSDGQISNHILHSNLSRKGLNYLVKSQTSISPQIANPLKGMLKSNIKSFAVP